MGGCTNMVGPCIAEVRVRYAEPHASAFDSFSARVFTFTTLESAYSLSER
jgi:hypothetical protein